ncbi:MAG: hypothetical protein A2622_05890 [Bdellovibrionales bacterium RIFCSPHIGHO2_01_FULL_40_29]|nr:MAG: hypothetical protein A2622_05890 [Bdellovibrionales bacterium RIFCSPHIGHO2_01_FULL_40_29]OFZ34984.1 MAG: hypothetical protein A3D17_06240 [Bdellovibrionales bacterium RIFCSPHIGHO2_02_FULL_40_15]
MLGHFIKVDNKTEISLKKNMSPDYHHVDFTNGQFDFSWSATSLFLKDNDSFLYIDGNITQFIETNIQLDLNNQLSSINALYLFYSENFVRHLDGLFLLVFKPKNSDEIFIVNNRYEANRLYYYLTETEFYFSESLKDLLSNFPIPRQPDFGSIRSFLSNGFIISEKTPVAGVSKMLPADYFIIKNSKIFQKSYWSDEIKFNRKPFDHLQNHISRYEHLYQQGLENYLRAKKSRRVGTLLSGGHDTSFVVIQAEKVLKRLKLPKLEAFTVTFPDWNFNEESYAANIAQKFDAAFTAIPFTAKDLDYAIDLIKANEEPVVGSSLPLHILMKKAGVDVDTMLGGDGGDTLWGEYYPVAEYHRLFFRFPLWFRKSIYTLSKLLRKLTDWERFWELEHVAKLFTEKNYHHDFLRKLCTYRHFDQDFQDKLLKTEILSHPYSNSHTEIKYSNKNFSDTLIESKLFNGFYTYQSFHTGKSARYFGMDLYLPTINKGVIDFINQLPADWINGGNFFQRLTNNKKINRKFHKAALSQYLKKSEIYNRSFDIPWTKILQPRKDFLWQLLDKLKARNWYNNNYLDQLFQEFLKQNLSATELLELKNHGYRIFTLMSLEIWCELFLDGKIFEEKLDTHLEDFLK